MRGLELEGGGDPRPGGRPPPPAARDGLLLPEGGVGSIDLLMRIEALGPRVHDRHRRALSGDIRGLAPDRGPLRPADRGHQRRAPERDSLERRELLRGAQGRGAELALAGVDAWITGIRREQSPHGPMRIRGMGCRPWEGMGDSIRSRHGARTTCGAMSPTADLPYHPLHDRGYESIGCAPCTRCPATAAMAVGRGEEDRVRSSRMSASP